MEKITSSIIGVCWLIFIAYWCLNALRVKRTTERKSWGSALAYRVPATFGIFMVWGINIPRQRNPVLIPHTDVTQILAAVVCVGGLLVAIWARRTLADNWSSSVTFKQGHELIRTGPYRFVRHPIYTGILLMVLGPVIEMERLWSWPGFALMFLSFWIKLKQEEELMLQHFPDQYPGYRKEVKALVPGII